MLGNGSLFTDEMKASIVENMNDNHMNYVVKSSSQTSLETIPFTLNKNLSLNQSPTLDTPLEDTSTKALLRNDIDDYFNDRGDFNHLHYEFFYYLYPNLFTNHGYTQNLLVSTSTWPYFDMVQNDNGVKLKNDQNLGILENNNAS